MASSKVMTSNSQNADLSRRASTASSSTKSITPSHTKQHHSSTMTFLNNNTQPSHSTLLDNSNSQRSVEDVWRDIVAGDVKEEPAGEEMMTLEDFLTRASADIEGDVKFSPADMIGVGRTGSGLFGFDPITPCVDGSIVGLNGGDVVGRTRRGRAVLEPMDKAAEQRQRRMIKNRESAARSRERKQAYEHELECLAARLEEENMELKKEKAEKARMRLQQLKDGIIPVEEKRRPVKVLRRSHSWTSSMLV